MKTRFSKYTYCRAFTFPETMVSAAVGMMALAGALTAHLVGLRMSQWMNTPARQSRD